MAGSPSAVQATAPGGAGCGRGCAAVVTQLLRECVDERAAFGAVGLRCGHGRDRDGLLPRRGLPQRGDDEDRR